MPKARVVVRVVAVACLLVGVACVPQPAAQRTPAVVRLNPRGSLSRAKQAVADTQEVAKGETGNNEKAGELVVAEEEAKAEAMRQREREREWKELEERVRVLKDLSEQYSTNAQALQSEVHDLLQTTQVAIAHNSTDPNQQLSVVELAAVRACTVDDVGLPILLGYYTGLLISTYSSPLEPLPTPIPVPPPGALGASGDASKIRAVNAAILNQNVAYEDDVTVAVRVEQGGEVDKEIQKGGVKKSERTPLPPPEMSSVDSEAEGLASEVSGVECEDGEYDKPGGCAACSATEQVCTAMKGVMEAACNRKSRKDSECKCPVGTEPKVFLLRHVLTHEYISGEACPGEYKMGLDMIRVNPDGTVQSTLTDNDNCRGDDWNNVQPSVVSKIEPNQVVYDDQENLAKCGGLLVSRQAACLGIQFGSEALTDPVTCPLVQRRTPAPPGTVLKARILDPAKPLDDELRPVDLKRFKGDNQDSWYNHLFLQGVMKFCCNRVSNYNRLSAALRLSSMYKCTDDNFKAPHPMCCNFLVTMKERYRALAETLPPFQEDSWYASRARGYFTLYPGWLTSAEAPKTGWFASWSNVYLKRFQCEGLSPKFTE